MMINCFDSFVTLFTNEYLVALFQSEVFVARRVLGKNLLIFNKSSRPEVLCENEFLEILQNSQKKTNARISLLKKLQEKRLWHRCFPVNFCEIF